MKKVALLSMNMLLSLGSFQFTSCMEKEQKINKPELISFEQAAESHGAVPGHITERWGVHATRVKTNVGDDVTNKVLSKMTKDKKGQVKFNGEYLHSPAVKAEIINRHMSTKTTDDQHKVRSNVQVALDNNISDTVFFPRYIFLGNTEEYMWYYVPITTKDVAAVLKIKKSKLKNR